MTTDFIKLDNCIYEIPKTGLMKVPGRIYATESMILAASKEKSVEQVKNVASLPGIVDAAIAMPDIHLGYGFPIGGVAAFDWEEGVVSPGGVGYDINCGVRLAATSLEKIDILGKIEPLVNALYRNIPLGKGKNGPVSLNKKELVRVLKTGSRWAVENGFGTDAHLEYTEENGAMEMADPDCVGERAFERGKRQLGTLGSGNHFMEIDVVSEIYDPHAAEVFGLSEDMVVLLLHSGSRGLGYQVCDDYLSAMTRQFHKEFSHIPDRQLVCAPIASEAGMRYIAAMCAAANYAWANRQVLMHLAYNTFLDTLSISPRNLGMRLVYDLCHNIAKKEEHLVNGKKKPVCVHRKGATRSFPRLHPDIPPRYREVGQPVIVPGDMGRASYVLKGGETAMKKTFGSTCHGAGRVLSRKAAVRAGKGRNIREELSQKGIEIRWTGKNTLYEEMPDAYKDVSGVVDVVDACGISEKVAKLVPLAVIKG